MTIQQRFEVFHKNNPRIYYLLVRFAIQTKEAGFQHYGIAALFERIRWHINMETKDRDGFKLSNDYRSRYARLLNSHPQLRDFFRVKPLRTL